MSRVEEFLFEHGIMQRESRQRQQVLACLACRWHNKAKAGDTPEAYAWQIHKCSQIKTETVYPFLYALEGAGVIVSEMEDQASAKGRGVARRHYSPSETSLGQAFEASLDNPIRCLLPDELR